MRPLLRMVVPRIGFCQFVRARLSRRGAELCDRRLEFLSAAIGETAFARVGWLSS